MFFKVLLMVYGLCVAFELKCPEPASWSFRARSLCNENSSFYYCLLSFVGYTQIYTENCSRVDLEAPGKKIVIRGNFDSSSCSSDKYQPITYWTNVSSDCLFLTSKCTEEGQVLYSDDPFHENDITCRCDFTKGYDFINTPKNPQFCIPSQEDCSCYKKICSDSSHILLTDYQCNGENISSPTETSSPVIDQELNTESNYTVINSDRVMWNLNARNSVFICIVVAAGVLAVWFKRNKIDNILNKKLFNITAEIPTTIQQLSAEEKELYIDIIRSGTEIRYYIRIVIIGENGVGKTCLLRRLLKESTNGVLSTDGVDIHHCRIRQSDGEWAFDEVSDRKKGFLSRIKAARHSSTVHINTLQEIVDNQNSTLAISLKDDTNIENSIQKSQNTSSKIGRGQMMEQNLLKADSVRRIVEDQSLTTKNNVLEDFKIDIESQSQPQQNNTVNRLLTKHVLQGLDDLLNSIETVAVTDEMFVECGLLDFAGEKEYYVTHPVFLNSNALHLLVANIMKDLKPITTDHKDGFDEIGEYLDFWLDTIHSSGGEETKEETKTEFLNPPAIIVCTRIDECRDNLDNRKNVFRKQLLSLLRNETKKKHVREICYVSNTDPGEEDFQSLRNTIFKHAKQMKTFAEKLPLRWIRLEQSLSILVEAGFNIISWLDIVELSSTFSINSEDEINLFLKYQHKIGSVVYFESLKEYIILNQKWLANAFRCLISDKYDSNLKLSDEWKALEDTGKLDYSLIVNLFDKDPELDYNKHSGHLLNVMEMFGIIVKITTLMENDQRQILPTYFMPCMISEKASVLDIIDMFNAKKDNCKRTPWLCIEFDFMPFDFFNHILCYYISKYPMCTEPETGRMAIYYGMGVFFLDNTKFRKFILCFCKNTIALQLWLWKDMEEGNYKAMLEDLLLLIEKVKEKFETRRVSYTVKVKCSDGNIHKPADRHSYSELVDLNEYFCEEHSVSHNIKDFLKTWFTDYRETEDYQSAQMKLKSRKDFRDTRFKEKCNVCDKEPSVYWCHFCQKSMCENCNNEHRKLYYTSRHIVQHVHDMYSLDYNFMVNVVINDIKMLHDNVLLIADHLGNQLVACHISGEQQYTISLPGEPYRIAVVDNNTVAVTLSTSVFTTAVVIADVKQRQVIQHIDVNVRCKGIMYRDNQLFVGYVDRTIKVMKMSGKVLRTIPVGVVPVYISESKTGSIYYTDNNKLYCIDAAGNTLFTFTNHVMSEPWSITTDDEGYVLVRCRKSSNVLRISPDGKHSQVMIKQIPLLSMFPYICYNSLSKSVVVGYDSAFFVYKKV